MKVLWTHMRPVLTKWATSHQGTKGDIFHWIFQKSIENKGISKGNNGFWTTNKPATLVYNISFESLESEQHESVFLDITWKWNVVTCLSFFGNRSHVTLFLIEH